MDEVERLETLQTTRQKRIPREPTEEEDRVRVCVNYCFEGEVTRFFLPNEQMVGVYDWVVS